MACLKRKQSRQSSTIALQIGPCQPQVPDDLYNLTPVSILGNIVFFIFGGFAIFLGYVLGGIVLCLTIVGIPFGLQCFKLAGGVLAPFGREVVEIDPPSGALSLILNIIWIILPGLELAIMHLVLAAFFALTIVGLPIAAQHIKLLPLALLPFGRRIRAAETGRTYG